MTAITIMKNLKLVRIAQNHRVMMLKLFQLMKTVVNRPVQKKIMQKSPATMNLFEYTVVNESDQITICPTMIRSAISPSVREIFVEMISNGLDQFWCFFFHFKNLENNSV